MRFWRATDGVCTEREPNGMTLLRFSHAGAFSLKALESPLELLDWLFDKNPASCKN
jgi:hypothetical protein